jgi:enoyl-CoA hydratase
MEHAMSTDLVCEMRDGVATLTFNRPQARNALTTAMYEELDRRVREITADASVKVVVLRGAGGKAFASGSEISEFLEYKDGADGLDYERRLNRVLESLERCPKPVIAAIEGACTGGGALIAAVSDLRIATRGTRIGVPVARTLGNCLAISSIVRVAALVGLARVQEMMITARLWEAEEAMARGFVSEVVDDSAALDSRVAMLARELSGHAPITMSTTKEQARRYKAAMIRLLEDDDLIDKTYGSEDFRQGVRSFVEKRAHKWSGS